MKATNHTEIIKVKELKFECRLDSSDQKTAKESARQVYRHRFNDDKYQFDILPGEHWLDLGANIGTFTVWALKKGAMVTSIEPGDDNYEMLFRNVQLNGVQEFSLKQLAVVGGEQEYVDLSLGKQGSEWRNSIVKKKSENFERQGAININELLERGYEYAVTGICKPYDGVKMDIEGAEVEVIRGIKDWKNLKKLVLEYHFDVHKDMTTFWEIIDILGKHFKNVKFGKLDRSLTSYKFFPPARNIWCY